MRSYLLSHYPCVLLLLSLLHISDISAANRHTGFLDLNLYPYLADVKSDNTLTLNAGLLLGHRLSYFSLTNLRDQEGQRELYDFDTFYTEQNLRWQISEDSPLDLTLQLNFRSGVDNDRHRLGIRWRLQDTPGLQATFKALHLSYSINLHAIQFDHEDGRVWQIEHVYRLTLPQLNERIYLAGFADHTFNQDLPEGFPSNPLVAETQLGLRLLGNLHAIAEYRLNQYRRSDVNNLALGLQYILKW